MHTGTKQVTQLTDIKVAMDSCPVANLKMIHTKFAFAYLKAAFNRHTRSGMLAVVWGIAQPVLVLWIHILREAGFVTIV